MENDTQTTLPKDMHEFCIWAQEALLEFNINDVTYALAVETIDSFRDCKEVHIPSIEEADAMCDKIVKAMTYDGKSRTLQILFEIAQGEGGELDVGYWVQRAFDEALNPTTN